VSTSVALRIETDGAGGVLVAVKAVPGSSRDEVVGVLGDRLKVRVSAPPEGGKANKAICAAIAEALGVKARDVEVVAGHTSPEKTVRINGATMNAVREALA